MTFMMIYERFPVVFCGASWLNRLLSGTRWKRCEGRTLTWTFLKPLSETRAPHPQLYWPCRSVCRVCSSPPPSECYPSAPQHVEWDWTLQTRTPLSIIRQMLKRLNCLQKQRQFLASVLYSQWEHQGISQSSTVSTQGPQMETRWGGGSSFSSQTYIKCTQTCTYIISPTTLKLPCLSLCVKISPCNNSLLSKQTHSRGVCLYLLLLMMFPKASCENNTDKKEE